MADTEKQGAMVVHEEGVIAPTLALPTTSSQSIFVVLKQLQSGESGKDQGSLMAISEANEMVKSTVGSVPTGIHATSSTLADTNNLIQSENMPADARCKGITATLDNNSMWNEFYRCQTEMILTKQGRRMFPYCRFRLSGMEPFQSYLLAMDIVPVDNYRYKWSGKGWETNGKAEPHVSHLFVHPESPATGLHWMQYPVSFYRLKLCNNLDQEDHIILHSMHRYLPRLHIIPADKDSENIQVDRPNVITLCFSQTEFFAVTAYQNLSITQLKIDYNPFAKGFRDDAVNARSSKARNGISTVEAESELKLSKEMTTLNNLKTLFMKRNAAVKVNKVQNVPSPTNGEGTAINGDAPIVNTNVQSLCSKKRPSSMAFSDFIKGAHVKVKRLSLENIKKNGVVLQASTTCTSEQMEVIDISSKTENILQVLKDETMAGDIHRSKSLETSSKTELEIDENKSEMDEHKGGKITLLSSDQNNEKGMETISSLDTVAKSEGNTKKALPHKRPERVPLPLLAQFLKQRKSKTRPTTPKPNVPSSSLDSEKSCEPVLTPENSSALLSSIPFVTHNSDAQPVLTSLSEKVTLLSTTEASNITSESTALSSPSATASLVPVEMQLSVRLSPSLICSDPLNVPNTTYSSKPDFDPTPDNISTVFHNDYAVSMPDLDNTLRSQSDISSLPTCDTVNDTCSQTTPEVNTDSANTPIVPSVTTSVLDVPSSTDNSIIPFQQLTSITDVAESDSMSDCPLDSSKGSCTELFSEEVPQNTLFTHKESLSLSLDNPSSPAFSLPSPAPPSLDPFPPSLFCERPVPPRKTLDSFPERLLDCTASSSPDLFPLGLFNDRPVPPRKILDFVTDITLDGTLTSKESLSPSVPSGPEHPRETIALFYQSQSTDRTGPLNDVQSAVSADTPIVPSVTTSVLDVPSSTDNSIIPFQQLTSITDVAESDSMSDCPLDSSKGSCTELFSEEVPQNTLFTHKESLSLSLDNPSSPAFSLPSPAPSSPDPFPPSLFCERPVPPRKTLDSFPERLLDCTASFSPDLFPLGLFNDRPVPPRKILDFVTDITLDGTLTSKEPLSPSVPSGPKHPRETIALFFQSQSSDRTGPLNDVQSAVSCETSVSDHIIPEPSKQSSHGITFKKSKAKQKKNGNLRFSENNEVFEGPIPVPMQPSLEDIEGQLFVCFMSKKALEIHLGDDAKSEAAQKTTENPDGASYENAEDKIEELEKILLNDLKVMRHRQVIHPVLQEVGLKLNLLDPTLEIDLQYLGVQLPIPPPVLSPERSSASSQIQFVSRTGKTSDFTKIKGWRDKFSGLGNPTEGMSSTDAGQKNLSAFCSDMLDEYLASEGKLIDERAATLSQADVTPVAYQLPIKSTSYVLTLDSVLKKQVPATLSTTSNKVKPKCKTKEENKSKKPLKSGTTMRTEPVFSVNKPALGLKKRQQNKKSKNKKESKSLSPAKPALETAAEVSSNKTSMVEVSGSIPSSCAAGRTTDLPKTLVKLMDVEDGAVWEGKHRTFITEERAAIALATLVTAERVSKGNPEAMRIIRRRAPPCLNVFCRLGCVCASLVHLRRHHHCGKPQCMLGCSCLRRKVVALKTPKQEQSATDESEPHVVSQENKAKWKKKNKKRKTYVLTNPETAPEPAKRVSILWDRKSDGSDSEALFCPPLLRAPSPALLPHELQHDLEIFFSPSKQKRVDERNLSMTEDNMENKLTCARSRPFSSMCRDKQKVVDQHHISQVSTQDIEEGELVPLNLSGPAKRLEIISECSWASTDTRNYIMQIVCEHMAQDRLKHPFWIGKYFIQPVSKTLQEKEDGSVDTYKVIISQPAEKTEDEKVTQNKAELKKDVEKSEVKGLPFLSRFCPAGLLKAEKKAPDAPGWIMVNGKSYPQAKLELGKMGALHPANRLAAYITGRICPVSQSGPNLVTTSTVTKASITSFPVSTVSTATTVTSTTGSTARPLKSVVTKPPVGKVFTQFVVNHINSQNLTNTSTSQLQSSVPKVAIPSSMLMIGEEAGAPGVALSPVKAGLVTQVSKPSESTGGSGLTPTTTVSSPGSTTTGKKTVYIKVMARSSGLTSSCPRFTKSATQTRPTQTQSQKVLLQVVKTADGKTLYRNPNGQLLQLVPLSQIKAIKPNLLSQGQPTIFRLPAPTAISPKKPQGGSTTIVKSLSPIPQTQTKPAVTVPVSTSSSMSTKPVTLTSSKAISLSSVPSTLKVVPGFLGQSGTCTLRILPPHPVQNTRIIAPTSSPVLPKSGFTLLKHGSSTLYNQDSTKSETAISVSSVSTEEAVGHVRNQSEENRCDNSERLAENISKLTSSGASTPKPSQFSGGGSSVAENGNKVNPIVTEKEFDIAPVSDEEEINSDVTELTDDSDLYSDDDDDQEDTYSLSGSSISPVIKGSDQVERRLDTDGLGSEMKDFAEVVVDIETIEESAEENCITKFRASALRQNKHLSKQRQIHNESLELKVRRVRLERIRRRTLKECFLKLQATLGKSSKYFETSKMRILTMAQNEIESLVKQDGRLIKKKQRLQIKRQRYLQTLSLLCDKSTESIIQKLNEIIAKQKALETQSKAKETSQLNEARPKPKAKRKLADLGSKQKGLAYQNKLKDVPKPTYSPSKPMDLSIKKPKSLEKTESASKPAPTASPANLDSSQITLKTQDKEKVSTSKPSQRSFNASPQKKPVSVPSPLKHSSIPRERTRPNILSRASSQVIQESPVEEPLLTNVCIPQVFPLMHTMVPYNQIITINNPLKTIGITSVGTPQSSTPGVASVSIVPAVSHPVGVENPLPLFHPQFIKIANSPVNINTQVDTTNIPNITNVISLIPPAENLVIPQKDVEEPTSVPAPVENQQYPSDVKIPDLEERAVVDETQSKDVPKQPVGGDENSAYVTSSNQDGKDKKGPDDSNDNEDENLLSLLDELVLLSQQLSNEDEDQRIIVPDGVQTCSDKQADLEQDDDRALSPLFLTLDEDLMSPDSKDEIDIPPKVDDLVKVIFGSDSPSVSSESGVAPSTNVQSPQAPVCSDKGDATTPPPLLHMKAACEAASGQSDHEGTSVAWRPMPKLVPLGLKAQDAVVNKVTGSPVFKPNSNEENVHRPQM